MVNVYHHKPLGVVIDADALSLFERQWAVYQKCVDNDYLSHKGAYRSLHELLIARFDGPFSFLDLACGNAGPCVGALQGTTVAHYHGVDLAMPALERAARNLDRLDCEVELEQSDYIDAIRNRPEPANVVWIGLSLHHLLADQKQELMREIRRMIGPEALFATYEPTLADDEDTTGFLDRYETHARGYFKALTPAELDVLCEHVRGSDFPESMASWRAIGEASGFARTELLFTDPHDLFRVLCFCG